MRTNHFADLDAALTAYLQPRLDKCMDLQTWARISAGGVWGGDEDLLSELNAEFDGVKATHATSYEMSCPSEPWTPTCCISMILTIKGVEIDFGVILVRSEIVALDFGEEEFPKDLQGIDLASELEKRRTLAVLSRNRGEI